VQKTIGHVIENQRLYSYDERAKPACGRIGGWIASMASF